MINFAGIYTLLALIAGVFYREFTKFNNFTGQTTLSLVHAHLLVLGAVLCLILALFAQQTDLLKQNKFQIFWKLYNIALPLVALMLAVRGVVQVLALNLSRILTASISGLSGLAHILLALALIYLFLALKAVAKK